VAVGEHQLRPVSLRHEGTELEGQIVGPAGAGPRPAILVMSSAMGLGPHYRAIAARLADEGYVALATDMYGGGAFHSAPKEAGASFEAVTRDPALLRSRVLAWYEALKQQTGVDPARMAAIGYCFGGQCVLELARSGADVKAVVSYHGLLKTTRPAAPGSVKPLVAVYTGARDPYAPQEDVEGFVAEMRHAGARWHLTTFGDAFHAFTTPEDGSLPREGLAYDPLADAVSWAGTLALLKLVLSP
jgi:dienelactone hydrolase